MFLRKFKDTRRYGRKATYEWGYNFVLGSASAWFEGDSSDALAFLRQHGLVDEALRPVGTRRS